MQGRGGPLEKYLAVPGANTNLPVSAGRQPVPLQFADDACAKFESFHCQLEGDRAINQGRRTGSPSQRRS